MTCLHAIDHRLQSAPDIAAFRFELIFTLTCSNAELTRQDLVRIEGDSSGKKPELACSAIVFQSSALMLA
jgi:hypothetical protein